MNQLPYVLPAIDTTYLDRFLLDREGKYRPSPVVELRRFEHSHLQVWCHLRARYNLPTAELIESVKTLIGGRSAIEIGAGMGDLGRSLGIPMTDSHQQTLPEMQFYYQSLGQPPIHPPADVEKLDAVAAITKYRPQVVVAAWVTQLYQEGDTPLKIGSNVYGVDEGWLLDNCETYIFVGNVRVHKDKRILARRHEEIRAGYIASRSADQSKNMIWIWNNR